MAKVAKISEAAKVETKKLITKVVVKTIKGTSFVSVREYQNSKGEVSNQTFLVGFDYENMLKNDLAKLKAFDVNLLGEGVNKEVAQLGLNELIESLEKRLSSDEFKAQLLSEGDSTMIRSEAQKNAYTPVCKGLKMQDNNLYIFGLEVRKTVIVPIEYKAVNSQPKTIAKKQIEKVEDVRSRKYKMFKLGGLETLQLQGVSI